MAESPSESISESLTTTSSTPDQSATTAISTPRSHHVPEIPIEIISEEEMAILDAAFAATRSFLPSAIRSAASPSRIISGESSKTARSITMFSKRKLSACSDIEDSLLHRFRKNQALGVTDLTGTVRLNLSLYQLCVLTPIDLLFSWLGVRRNGVRNKWRMFCVLGGGKLAKL